MFFMSVGEVIASFLSLLRAIEMFYWYPEMSIAKLYDIEPVFSFGRSIVSGMSMYAVVK
jgi:hypothetical protein